MARFPELHVVDCAHCGVRFASPQLTPAHRTALYAQSYFQSADSGALGYEDYDADRPQLLHTFRDRLGSLTRHLHGPGRLLDVGCATGIAVQAARDLGWNAEGIDLSEYAVQQGREQYGQPLHCAELETWQSPLAPYDAITMWDYLEHVPDPCRTLRAAFNLLRPGGRLVITTPDVASVPARWYGAKWMGYKRDEHLVYLSTVQLRACLRAAGFRPLFDHYVGKHIRLDFFCLRLRGYAPRIGAALGRLLDITRLGRVVVYVNPLDIVCATAERPRESGP